VPRTLRQLGEAKTTGTTSTGGETLEAKAERSKVLAELREIEALSFAYGLVPKETPRWRGRKPKR